MQNSNLPSPSLPRRSSAKAGSDLPVRGSKFADGRIRRRGLRTPSGFFNPSILAPFSLCSVSTLLAMLGIAATPALAATISSDWVSPPGLTPTARADAAMVYDVARQQVVLFGGIVGGGGLAGLNNETWLLEFGNWRQAGPQHFPLGRQNAGVAYDSADQQVVLFGGYTAGAVQFADSNDTWTWNGTDWSQVSTSALPGGAPSARESPAMAYFPDLAEIILFGGLSSTNVQTSAQNDTWGWDGAAWTQLSPAISPPARYAATLVYDTAHQQLVLFGGAGLNDTWTFDGTTWTQQHPSASPSVRSYAVATYDADHATVLLYGGLDQSGTPLGDTWTWDGTTWTQQQPAHTPGLRGDAMLAYDASQHRAFLFGGDNAATAFGDTWAWDGTDWTSSGEATQPPPRISAPMVYDPRQKNSVLFGGVGGGISGLFNDLWTWDGRTWAQRQPATVPPARAYMPFADDPEVGRLVMFGGFGAGQVLSDTWSWDGSNWAQEQPAHSPAARLGAALAFDGTHLLLYGGWNGTNTAFADTWSWDGNDWTQLLPTTSPSARYNGAMTYDPVHHQVVLFGGTEEVITSPTGGGVANPVAETWTWDGTIWTQRHPAHSPPAVALQSMIFDPDLGGVVMFNGGQGSAADFDLTGTKGFFNNQLWLWDGTDWTQLFTVTVPGARGAESLAYDATRHALVLYGGNGVHGIQGDTWRLLPPPVQLTAAVSQKLHGSAGTFDVDLLLTGSPGIECRSGGANGDYTIVFSFAASLTSVGGASVSSGTGTVSSCAIDNNDAHNYVVNLTGVTNAQVIAVSLTNLTDSLGNFSSGLLPASMGVLVGDATANGSVSNTDVAAVKAQVATPVTSSNFRNDVNANGVVSNTDVSTTKAQVGTSLP